MQRFSLSEKSFLLYYPHFLSNTQSQFYLDKFIENLNWEKTKIKIFGKEVLEPRLVTFFADPGISYTYSGSKRKGLIWNKELLEIRNSLPGTDFNSALVNYYESGNNHMGWHSDNEPELGKNPIVHSLTLGSRRKMSFRSKKTKGKSVLDIELEDGSLLIMKGEIQHEFDHCIRKTLKPIGPRVNITFRKILIK